MNTKTLRTEREKKNSATSTKTSPSRRKVQKRWGMGTGRMIALAVSFAIVVLGVIFLGVIFFLNQNASSSQAGQYPFQVGQPGPGKQAPPITLPSTAGGTFNLAAMRGQTVLLYFQEGLTCQPCWDQLKDIQSNISQIRALGIDQVVSITTDPLDALQQKVTDEAITLPVLSDSGLVVSQAYTANGYGMMGASRDGHTFIVVGPDGQIKWRAEYGGAPKYTMYLPIPNLVADIRAGLNGKSS